MRYIVALLFALFATQAEAQYFPGYGAQNNFYVGNGSSRGPSWYTPANARTAIGVATWTVPTGVVPLANGGTNQALVASAGGIVWSDLTKLNILPGTVTPGQCLLSGNLATPTWGSCSGAAAVSSVTAADSSLTITPTTGAVTAAINVANANSWTALQTFANSNLRLLGSSTGGTTFNSANAGTSNFVITIPAVTDTLATLNAAQAFGGALTFNGAVNFASTFSVNANLITWPGVPTSVAALNIANQLVSGGANNVTYPIGTVSSGTTTINCGNGQQQSMTNNGASTIAAPVTDGSCNVQLTNGASAGAITFSGFTVNPSYTGATMTTNPGNQFLVTVNRNNGTSNYFVVPYQ